MLTLNPYEADTVLVIDVHNLVHRSWHNPRPLSAKNGQPTSHIFYAIQKLNTMIGKFKNQKVCLALSSDEYSSSKRSVLPEYKAHRNHQPAVGTLSDGDEYSIDVVPDSISYLEMLPHLKLFIPTKDAETDDIIATFVYNLPRDKNIVILSTDKDLWWLLHLKNVTIFRGETSADGSHIVSIKDVVKRFGVSDPRKIPLAKVTTIGDSSDAIPKIPRLTVNNSGVVMESCKRKKGQNWITAFEQAVKRNNDPKIVKLLESGIEQARRIYPIVKLQVRLSIKTKIVKGDIESLIERLSLLDIKKSVLSNFIKSTAN